MLSRTKIEMMEQETITEEMMEEITESDCVEFVRFGEESENSKIRYTIGIKEEMENGYGAAEIDVYVQK